MKQNKKLIHTITQTLLATGFEHTIINSISTSEQLIELILQLPYHTDLDDLKHILPNLQMELAATDHKITNTEGKRITIHFGKANIDTVPFNKSSHIKPNTLEITVESTFGPLTFDFEDGASCHMLLGGAPRMGKTFSLIYIATMVYIQNNANIDLYIISQKGRDFYPFEIKKNIEIVTEEEDFNVLLDTLIDKYKERNKILYTLSKATDSKSVKKLHPDKYHLFRPIFIIIDEYADYIHRKDIQEKVGELVRKAGYLNVHVIICTQRPEARFTVPANIKMGLQLRLSLPVTDTNNSVVILDEEGAEKLPKIKGRAIVKDGECTTVQIPLLEYDTCEELLSNYERNVSRETINITENKQDHPRQNDKELSLKIQNMFKESTSLPTIQPEYEPDKRMQPRHETINNGWFRLSSPSIKR